MIEPVSVDSTLIHQLADPQDPLLRVKVLSDLLDYPDDDPDLVKTRKDIPNSPWVKATLAAHNGDGTWSDRHASSFYRKYTGTSWVMLHMSELGVPGNLEPVKRGVEYLLSNTKPISGLKSKQGMGVLDSECKEGVYWHHPILCLVAHMATVLIRYGHESQPITRAALASCKCHFVPGEGFDCSVMDYYSLLPKCYMVVPKVLKAFLALPPKVRTKDDIKFINQLVKILKKFKLHIYVPKDSKEWQEWSYSASPEERMAARKKWIEDGRLEPRREKAGWLRFSFPNNYNSDLLEVMLLLGKAGVKRDKIIDSGLEILLDKRQKNGMWKMVGGINGKMYADIDKKGKPSPWITYRALLALKRFDLLKIEL